MRTATESPARVVAVPGGAAPRVRGVEFSSLEFDEATFPRGSNNGLSTPVRESVVEFRDKCASNGGGDDIRCRVPARVK